MKSVAKLLPLSEGSKLTSRFSNHPLCLTVDRQHSLSQDERGKVVSCSPLSNWLRGHGPRRWLGSDLLPCSPKFWTLTKKVLFLLLQEREEQQSTSCCWKDSLVAEHQPLLTMASSSSNGSINRSALLSSLCPSPLIQLQTSERGVSLHR